MRPPKVVALLARNEQEMGEWRCSLRTAGYRVHAVLSLTALKAALVENPTTCVVVSQWGSPNVATIVAQFNVENPDAQCKLLLFDLPGGTDVPCDALEVSGPGLAARVKDTIERLSSKKRGPKAAAGRVRGPAIQPEPEAQAV